MSIAARSEADLRDVLSTVPGVDLSAADDDHAVDGVAPTLIASPLSIEDLAALLARASDNGASVIPWGSGSQMALANEPADYDIALSTTRLNRIVEYEPADLTITVEAGVTLGHLRHHLAQHGQFLPIDGPDEAAIGGRLAVGHGGPSQHGHGSPRDWVLGCKLALADGTIVCAGGRVVKNVAGYDLTRMAVGSLGTLAVIVEATLKVAPVPPVQETFLAACPDSSAALDVARAVARRGLSLRAVAVVENQVACWLAGPAAAVERSRAELGAALGQVEARTLVGDEADRWWASLDRLDATSEVTLRASVPPSEVGAMMESLARTAGDAGGSVKRVAFPSAGIVIARLANATTDGYTRVIDQARRDAVAGSGSLVVIKAPADVKECVDVWGESPALPLMLRLKQEFDPRGTLNPGRFVGGI